MIDKSCVVFLGVRRLCGKQLCRCEGKDAGREGHVMDAGDDGERRRKRKAEHQAPAITSLTGEMMVSTEDLLRSHNSDSKKWSSLTAGKQNHLTC